MKSGMVRVIRGRLGLSQSVMAEILDVDVKELKLIESDSIEMSTRVIERLREVFDINGLVITDSALEEGLLVMTMEISTKEYDNIFKAYVETLKRFFPNPWQVYVLSKVKVKKGIGGFFDLFFNNNRVSVASEMKYFSPTYLVISDDVNLIVNFEKISLKIFELGELDSYERFEFNGYRYVRANKITIKKD